MTEELQNTEKEFFFAITGLDEDKVWQENIYPLLQNLPTEVLKICRYGFTEMLNNAIDHSESEAVLVKCQRTDQLIVLQILDMGVGIFKKIKKAFNLEDEQHSILELSKGKLTTDQSRHSGEGIFFTSKAFDSFTILSGTLYFGHNSEKIDWIFDHGQAMSKVHS